MQTYDSLNEAWIDIVGHCARGGDFLESRDGPCFELVGQSFKLNDARNSVLTVPERNMSLPYAAAETLWYFSGESKIDRLLPYAPSYSRFADPKTNEAHGAYGNRWQNDHAFLVAKAQRKVVSPSQVAAAISLLQGQPNTRQCVISMWNAADLVHAMSREVPDIPCTVCVQLVLRKDKLHAVTYMRSNDVWLGMPYDVYAFTVLQSVVAAHLRVEVGSYTHNVGSLHLYARHADRCLELTDVRPGRLRESGGWDSMQLAVEIEEKIRLGEKVYIPSVLGGLEKDMLEACWEKLC